MKGITLSTAGGQQRGVYRFQVQGSQFEPPSGVWTMKLPIRPDAAAIRTWAVATGRAVGSRGAISAQLQNEYFVALAKDRLLRTAVTVGRLALSVAPDAVRTIASRRTGGQTQRDVPHASAQPPVE